MTFRPGRGLKGMTIIANTPARIRPAGHAYVVPVVREVAPQQVAVSAAVW